MAKKDEVKKVEDSINETPENIEGVVEKKSKKSDVVEINREDLAKLLKTVETQSKDIDLLYLAADKNRLAKVQDLKGENLVKTCKISTWMDTGKLIVGWKLIKNISQVVMGRTIEDQQVTVVFEDGTTETTTLLEFYRNTISKVEADIISRNEESDAKGKKTIFFNLELEDGKKLLINSAFIN